MKAYHEAKYTSIGKWHWVAYALLAIIVIATCLCLLLPSRQGATVHIFKNGAEAIYDIQDNCVPLYSGVRVHIVDGEVFCVYVIKDKAGNVVREYTSRTIDKVGEVLVYPQAGIVVTIE